VLISAAPAAALTIQHHAPARPQHHRNLGFEGKLRTCHTRHVLRRANHHWRMLTIRLCHR
jgi:hypothetical protein